jgi:hypothetical protein
MQIAPLQTKLPFARKPAAAVIAAYDNAFGPYWSAVRSNAARFQWPRSAAAAYVPRR